MGSVIISLHSMTSSFPTVAVCPWRRSYRCDDRSAGDCRTVGWSRWCEWPVDWWSGASRDDQRPGRPAQLGWTENMVGVNLQSRLCRTTFPVTHMVWKETEEGPTVDRTLWDISRDDPARTAADTTPWTVRGKETEEDQGDLGRRMSRTFTQHSIAICALLTMCTDYPFEANY